MKNQTKKGIQFEADLWRYMKLRGISSKESLRKLTTVGGNKTFLKYFEDPERMPIGVMSQIMDALRVPETDRQEIIKKIL